MVDFKIPKFEPLQPYEDEDDTTQGQEEEAPTTKSESKTPAMLTPILVPNELDEMLKTVKSKFN
jgi:hypothetical protein